MPEMRKGCAVDARNRRLDHRLRFRLRWQRQRGLTSERAQLAKYHAQRHGNNGDRCSSQRHRDTRPSQ